MPSPEPPTEAEVAAELEERVEVDATLEGEMAKAMYETAMARAGIKPAVIDGKWAALPRDLRAGWLAYAGAALDVIVAES